MQNRSTQELLATLLAGPAAETPGTHAADTLLHEHGGLRGVFRAAASLPASITNKPGEAGLIKLAAAAELCRRRLFEPLSAGEPLTSPAQSVEYLQSTLVDLGREVFIALFLDTRHRVIRAEPLFQGSIDGACVYPRVVAERALRLGAAAVIVAHNHPSGIAEPSLADQAITRRLKDALSLLEIRLLDHFIVGEGEPVSLASRGLL